ncbi:LLM class flavin-dependent oxidoreductase [Pelistega sp. MC2]|uniref:LLM class flavin-dependent oxidoreductase n=1 Tax=Pelistega sp. MC2 TaxID=1720297 RepID=UPI0008DAE288|nr:LLM class flavin-dependent oxidoreductase [Pelistega sp. MC2]
MSNTAVSMLNLVPLREGQTHRQAFDSMIRLAQHAESLNYARYWIAEHHNMPNILSSATQLLIGHTLAQTKSIRVGSGGVMLPNHSPLQVAEQYGTLATLYPNRVDLGLGRAPGTDPRTAMALRRGNQDVSLNFPDDVEELQRYFGDADKQGYVKAYLAMGKHLPLYILGSSTESAFLAAAKGLPYVFAAHFAPRLLETAVQIYRQQFQPSDVLDKPKVIVGINAVVAETDEEAKFLSTSQEQQFLGVVSGRMRPLQPPVQDMSALWTASEEFAVRQMLAASIVGGKETVAQHLESFQRVIRADELMVTNYVYDEGKQAQSFAWFKEIVDNLS